MKRLITIFCSLILIVCSVFSVFAIQNDPTREVLSALRSGAQTNEGTIHIPSKYLNQAENYFNSNSYNLTEEQKDEILSYIENSRQAIRDYGVTSIAQIKSNPELKNILISNAQKACNVVGLKLTVDGETFTITDADGNIVLTTGSVIKTTGANFDVTNAAVISIVTLSIIGLALFGAYKLKKI